jgi:DNA-binding CsgD family transcriptional regulator
VGRELSGLLERERELAELDQVVAQARERGGELVLIEGEAGIGKTRLLDHVAVRARQAEYELLVARGGPLEADVSYGVVRQLFERRVEWASPAQRRRWLTGAARFAAPLVGHAQGPTNVESAEHGLLWLVANMAQERPVAMVVDDLHWCDTASLRFLVYLARRVLGMPVLIAAALRPRELGEHERLVAMLGAEPIATRVTVHPLSQDGSTLFLSDRLSAEPSQAMARACHEAAGGNPFFLSEIAQALISEGVKPTDDAIERVKELAPEGVRRALLGRIGMLGDDARTVSHALAVLGDDPSLAVLSAVSGLERGRVIETLEALSAISVTAPGALARFAHPIIRNALYEDTPQPRRVLLHERAARALRAHGADPQAVARHLIECEPAADAEAVATLTEAGMRAAEAGAWPDAARAFSRALREAKPDAASPELRFALGDAELSCGRSSEAAEHLRIALDRATDDDLRVRAAVRLAAALSMDGDGEGALEALRARARTMTGDHALRLEVERTLLAVWMPTHATGAQARMRELSRLSGHTPAERLALANAALATAYDPTAHASEAASIAGRALADGELLRDQQGEQLLYAIGIYVLIMAEELDAADREIARLAGWARGHGSPFAFAKSCLLSTQSAYLRGDLARAIADAETAWDTLRALDQTAVVTRSAIFDVYYLVRALLARGDAGRAIAFITELEANGYFDVPEHVWARHGRALVRLHAQQDDAGASADLQAVSDQARATGYEDRDSPWRLDAAVAATRLGERSEAEALLDEQLQLATTWGTPGLIGATLTAKARIEGRVRRSQLLEEAVEVLRGSPQRLSLARALIDRGVALCREGHRTQARAALEEGMELAGRCEALPLAARAREELRTLGARPRRLAFSGVESLTASERRVAEMAARGMTNREIAQALFVTLKTVEMHLSRAYRKLGIRRRDQLAEQLEHSAPVTAAIA